MPELKTKAKLGLVVLGLAILAYIFNSIGLTFTVSVWIFDLNFMIWTTAILIILSIPLLFKVVSKQKRQLEDENPLAGLRLDLFKEQDKLEQTS